MFVYCIINKINLKKYIGVTTETNPLIRWNRHKSFAKDKTKKNFQIHDAILKHGEENFIFEVIDATAKTKEELFFLEKHYIKELDTYRNGYNMTLGGEKSLSGKDHTFYGKKRPEHSQQMSGMKNPWYGNNRKDHMQKLAKYNTGKKHTEEHKRKISEASKGRIHSKESKRKMSISKIGKTRPKHVIEAVKLACSHPILQFTITGRLLGEYVSIKDAVRQTNVSESTIHRALKKDGRKIAKGYLWCYASIITPKELDRIRREANTHTQTENKSCLKR